MDHARYVRWLRSVLLACGVAWRLFVAWTVGARNGASAVVLFLFGVTPYLALAAVAPAFRGRWALGLVAAGVLAIDVAAWVMVRSRAVAPEGWIAFATILSGLVVAVAAALLGARAVWRAYRDGSGRKG